MSRSLRLRSPYCHRDLDTSVHLNIIGNKKSFHPLEIDLRTYSQWKVPLLMKFRRLFLLMPIPMVARSKASVCGRSLAGIVGSNPTGGMDVRLL